MSDENNNTPAPEATPPAAGGADEIKNLKAEMNRKLSNVEATTQQLAQLLQQLQKPAPEATGPKKVSVFEDEEAYARTIEERAAQRIEAKLAAERASQAKQQQVVASLVEQFPELGQNDSPLTKLALDKYNALDPSERTPIAMKAAAAEAALELGIAPKSRRKAPTEDDNFALSGASGTKVASKRETAEAEQVRNFLAEAMGINIKDKAVVERVSKRHGRKSYSNWE